jgi:Gpi18-like mannosyltransferase
MGQVHLPMSGLTDRLRRIAQDKAVRWALVVFLTVRLALSVVAAIVITLRPLPEGGHEAYISSFGLRPVEDPRQELLLEVWQRWDVIHYQRIAAQGYTDDASSAFAPLLPSLMALLGAALGGNHLLAGVLISNVSLLLALVYLYKLTELDYNEQVARRTVLYLSIFPTAFFLSIPYTESLYLLSVVLFFHAALRRDWVTACVATVIASLTRFQGLVLIIPWGFEYLKHIGFDPRRVRWHVLLIPLALVPPVTFLWLRTLAGYPGLADVLAEHWRSSFGAPWHSLLRLWTLATSSSLSANDVLDTVIAVPFLGLVLASLLRTRTSYRLYVIATLLLILSVVYTPPPLMNIPRHMLVFFPTFMFMASVAKRPIVHRAIVYGSTALLMLLTGMFVQWFWVA